MKESTRRRIMETLSLCVALLCMVSGSMNVVSAIVKSGNFDKMMLHIVVAIFIFMIGVSNWIWWHFEHKLRKSGENAERDFRGKVAGMFLGKVIKYELCNSDPDIFAISIDGVGRDDPKLAELDGLIHELQPKMHNFYIVSAV